MNSFSTRAEHQVIFFENIQIKKNFKDDVETQVRPYYQGPLKTTSLAGKS